MACENAEIIVLSPTHIDACLLPSQAIGRFWLNRQKDQRHIPIVEVCGKENEWYLLKNHICDFPVDFPKQYPLTTTKQVCIKHEHDLIYLLYMQKDSFQYRYYALDKSKTYQIGRHKACAICIQDAMISHHHATLYYQDQNWYIKDEQSRNGLYLNAIRIKQEKLKVGDRIQIMQYLFIMGKDTIFIVIQDTMRIHMAEGIEKTSCKNPCAYQNILPSVHESFIVEPLELTIEQPMEISQADDTPFFMSAGPSFIMGIASMAMAIVSVTSMKANHESFTSILPTLIMSGSMASTMMLWPIMTRIYEKRKRKQKEANMQERYLTYLEHMRKEIEAYQRKECQSRASQYEDTQDALKLLNKSPWKLHNRLPNDLNFLFITIGKGDCKADIHLHSNVEAVIHEENICWEHYHLFMQNTTKLHHQNITINCQKDHKIGIYGKELLCQQFLVDIMLQIYLLHHREHITFCILADIAFIKQYALSFLPAVFFDETRFIVCDKQTGKQVNYALKQWWKQKDEEDHLLIFSFDRHLEQNMEYLSYLLKEEQVVYFQIAPYLQLLHPKCEDIIQIIDDTHLIFQHEELQIHLSTSQEIKEAISKYHTYHFPRQQQQGFPSSFTFLDLFGCANVEQLQILKRWKKQAASLEALIGINEHGETISIDLHEHFHGPHGLIAGMTGSGKSEWIMTLILSLAISYSPSQLSFVLIDYKGGGMSQAFSKLPHVAGVITNLDNDQIMRSIQGIQSELTRRQEIFKSMQETCQKHVMHIDQYQQLYKEGTVSQPLSHILIIADEFAELKQQQPQFMEDLKKISRIGRSLGIHLLLATQKPSGIVDDQIWSNARFHVCLKVADRMDSVEMLKKEDAIYLKQAGMFYLQVGYDEWYIKGMGAWANAPYYEKTKYEPFSQNQISIISPTGEPLYEKAIEEKTKSTMTQLEAVVQHIQICAQKSNEKANALWLPPLTRDIEKTEPFMLGIVDDPIHQKRFSLLLKQEHMAFIGAREEDKDYFLRAILSSIQQLDAYCYVLDHCMKNYQSVDDVILYEDKEKMESFFYQIKQQLHIRKKYGYNKFIYCIFQHYEMVNIQDTTYMEDIRMLLKEGANFGIYICLGMQDPYALTYQIKTYLHDIYCFYMEEKDDYHVLFHHCEVMPNKICGRGIFEKDAQIYQFQCVKASVIEKTNRQLIPVLPKHIAVKKKKGHVYIGKHVISKEDIFLKEEEVVMLCDQSFYEPFQNAVIKQGCKFEMYAMQKITENLNLHDKTILWNGPNLNAATYSLHLPYFNEEHIEERMGILWKDGNYHTIQLVEDITYG